MRAPDTSAVKASRLAPVAFSTLATLSVLGQRFRPSGMTRFEGLKVVGSSPERLARPEADRPFSAASVSIARQISSCFIDAILHALRAGTRRSAAVPASGTAGSPRRGRRGAGAAESARAQHYRILAPKLIGKNRTRSTCNRMQPMVLCSCYVHPSACPRKETATMAAAALCMLPRHAARHSHANNRPSRSTARTRHGSGPWRRFVARRDGARYTANQGRVQRPCEPDDVVKCLDTLYRRRRIDLVHARILRIWGERQCAPNPAHPASVATGGCGARRWTGWSGRCASRVSSPDFSVILGNFP